MTTYRRDRRFKRAPFFETIALWKNRRPHPVKAQNLSAGGVFISTDQTYGEGALLTLRVALPGSCGFTVLGKVVRNHRSRLPFNTNGVAVRFVDIAPRHQRLVTRYVERFQL